MPYLVNVKSGLIHDASKSHTAKLVGPHFATVNTIPEAKSIVLKNGIKPRACTKCGFNKATIEECDT